MTELEAIIVLIGILYTGVVVCFFYGLVVPLLELQEEIQEWIDENDNAESDNKDAT